MEKYRLSLVTYFLFGTATPIGTGSTHSRGF